MSIEWTDEAVSDALRKYLDSCGSMPLEDAMRAALDAAVEAQGFEVMLWKNRKDVRAEALEEAAQFIAKWASDEDEDEIRGLIEAIRNLAKEGK